MSAANKITMGVIATKTGCNVETVRYYEKINLMPEPARSQGGHRLYTEDHIKRLTFIRRCRDLGFSIEQVKKLLVFTDEPEHSCGEVRAMTLLHAKDIRKKIKDLTRLEKSLKSIMGKCEGEKLSVENCPIIDMLFK